MKKIPFALFGAGALFIPVFLSSCGSENTDTGNLSELQERIENDEYYLMSVSDQSFLMKGTDNIYRYRTTASDYNYGAMVSLSTIALNGDYFLSVNYSKENGHMDGITTSEKLDNGLKQGHIELKDGKFSLDFDLSGYTMTKGTRVEQDIAGNNVDMPYYASQGGYIAYDGKEAVISVGNYDTKIYFMDSPYTKSKGYEYYSDEDILKDGFKDNTDLSAKMNEVKNGTFKNYTDHSTKVITDASNLLRNVYKTNTAYGNGTITPSGFTLTENEDTEYYVTSDSDKHYNLETTSHFISNERTYYDYLAGDKLYYYPEEAIILSSYKSDLFYFLNHYLNQPSEVYSSIIDGDFKDSNNNAYYATIDGNTLSFFKASADTPEFTVNFNTSNPYESRHHVTDLSASDLWNSAEFESSNITDSSDNLITENYSNGVIVNGNSYIRSESGYTAYSYAPGEDSKIHRVSESVADYTASLDSNLALFLKEFKKMEYSEAYTKIDGDILVLGYAKGNSSLDKVTVGIYNEYYEVTIVNGDSTSTYKFLKDSKKEEALEIPGEDDITIAYQTMKYYSNYTYQGYVKISSLDSSGSYIEDTTVGYYKSAKELKYTLTEKSKINGSENTDVTAYIITEPTDEKYQGSYAYAIINHNTDSSGGYIPVASRDALNVIYGMQELFNGNKYQLDSSTGKYVRSDRFTYNGNTIIRSELTKNSDGSYEITVTYEVTGNSGEKGTYTATYSFSAIGTTTY